MAAGATTIQGGRWRRAWQAIDERLGLSGLAYPVPAHANGIGYILGGITFFGFLILAGDRGLARPVLPPDARRRRARASSTS